MHATEVTVAAGWFTTPHVRLFGQQAKKILKRLSSLATLPTEMSIDSGDYVFQCVGWIAVVASGSCGADVFPPCVATTATATSLRMAYAF